MKTNLNKLALLIPVIASSLLLAATAKAVNYAGNGDTSFGGAVGNGTLSVTDDGTNITFTLVTASGLGGNDLVLYIDSKSGGFADTSGFTDTGDGGRRAVSGYDGGNRSTMTFTNGFVPEYAVDIQGGYASLFQLANGGSHTWITGAGQSGSTYTLTIAASQIGLSAGTPADIRLFGTFISETGYRSQEAIAGNDYGAFGSGWNPFSQTAFATYAFAAPPPATNYVTFRVDMTAQVDNAAFDPGNGDTVYVGGSFESVPFAFSLQLTNDPGAANTNIYSGTYPDLNPSGTAEQYKFKFYSVANATDTYDDNPNRPFTLLSGGQVLPLVYFNNVPAVPSATTNTIVFQIDMGPRIYLGQFDPNLGDTIQVYGSFQSPKWSGGLILTNDPLSAEPNIYSGSFEDGNYPGTVHQYKYVIVNGATTTYESISDRNLATPTNSGTLPLAYFNNVSTYGAVPITFQVDMTLPLALGMFVPANGDTVSAAGTFQTNQWTVNDFVLTNNPSGPNPNIYSGTYVDRNAPGSGELYKFQINTNGGGTAWESIANRTFLLGGSAQTLPLVLWNNASTNNVILQPTLVTFSVDMSGAVDVFGNPFDPGNDAVLVDGNYYSPGWDLMSNASYENPLVFTDHVMTQVGSSSIYTNSFLVPAGHAFEVIYKYGIYHDTANFNTNIDNEAGFGLNHVRYIRSVPACEFPVDIFGQQRTNAAAATETAFGNLKIGAPSAGHFPINWLGLPSVRLQVCTNLAAPVWLDIPDTAGLSSTNWPATGGQEFFRLVWLQ